RSSAAHSHTVVQSEQYARRTLHWKFILRILRSHACAGARPAAGALVASSARSGANSETPQLFIQTTGGFDGKAGTARPLAERRVRHGTPAHSRTRKPRQRHGELSAGRRPAA